MAAQNVITLPRYRTREHMDAAQSIDRLANQALDDAFSKLWKRAIAKYPSIRTGTIMKAYAHVVRREAARINRAGH